MAIASETPGGESPEAMKYSPENAEKIRSQLNSLSVNADKYSNDFLEELSRNDNDLYKKFVDISENPSKFTTQETSQYLQRLNAFLTQFEGETKAFSKQIEKNKAEFGPVIESLASYYPDVTFSTEFLRHLKAENPKSYYANETAMAANLFGYSPLAKNAALWFKNNFDGWKKGQEVVAIAKEQAKRNKIDGDAIGLVKNVPVETVVNKLKSYLAGGANNKADETLKTITNLFDISLQETRNGGARVVIEGPESEVIHKDYAKKIQVAMQKESVWTVGVPIKEPLTDGTIKTIITALPSQTASSAPATPATTPALSGETPSTPETVPDTPAEDGETPGVTTPATPDVPGGGESPSTKEPAKPEVPAEKVPEAPKSTLEFTSDTKGAEKMRKLDITMEEGSTELKSESPSASGISGIDFKDAKSLDISVAKPFGDKLKLTVVKKAYPYETVVLKGKDWEELVKVAQKKYPEGLQQAPGETPTTEKKGKEKPDLSGLRDQLQSTKVGTKGAIEVAKSEAKDGRKEVKDTKKVARDLVAGAREDIREARQGGKKGEKPAENEALAEPSAPVAKEEGSSDVKEKTEEVAAEDRPEGGTTTKKEIRKDVRKKTRAEELEARKVAKTGEKMEKRMAKTEEAVAKLERPNLTDEELDPSGVARVLEVASAPTPELNADEVPAADNGGGTRPSAAETPPSA